RSPASPTVSGRPTRRSCPDAPPVPVATPPPRSPSATLPPVSVARRTSSRHFLAPAPAIFSCPAFRLASTATPPRAPQTTEPCTRAASPSESSATQRQIPCPPPDSPRRPPTNDLPRQTPAPRPPPVSPPHAAPTPLPLLPTPPGSP